MSRTDNFKGKNKNIQIFSAHPYGSAGLSKLEALSLRVLRAEGWSFNLDIIIADDPELRRLNRLFLGVDESTDVIAFPADEEEQSGGEVYISLDQARAQALEAKESVQKTLSRLLVHGILHLGGWSDAADTERERMLSHGERYLSEEGMQDV